MKGVGCQPRVVVEGQDRQPLHQEGHALPLTPSPLALRQPQSERQLDGDCSTLSDFVRQVDLECRVVVSARKKNGSRTWDAASLGPTSSTSDTLWTCSGGPFKSMASLGAETEDLERLRIEGELIFRDGEVRVGIEDRDCSTASRRGSSTSPAR